ncbi:MAG: nuclear transport factor 2 family protein [Chloroflexi bacterium]|nr:nuclear transport factor 2 family protein [Chloroflexota bacterium]
MNFVQTAEEEIRRLMGRYIQAHDTRNVDAIVPLFADDGLFTNEAGEWSGRDRIREFFENSRARAVPGRRSKLMCANSIISVDGEQAEALTDVVGFRSDDNGPWQVSLVAQYADKFVRRDGEWRYAEKRVLT